MTNITFNGDCLEVMRDLSDNIIDLLFCDLPYGQTNCKWDCKINLVTFWKEINRICKINCPMFFTTTTRFGVELINSNPKNFRYDLVWVKSAGTGFLCAKKMPMRKHEMIYVFYRKLPFYDLSSHTHKFIKETESKRKPSSDNSSCYTNGSKSGMETSNKYDPPLPNSVITTKLRENVTGLYGNETKKLFIYEDGKLKNTEPFYEPPLPNSILKEGNLTEKEKHGELYGCGNTRKNPLFNSNLIYKPSLPNSILEVKSEKGKHATQKPIELMKWLLKYYSKEGDTILDPTMGSGSTGVACKMMNRKFIGIEKDENIYNDAIERINKN